MEKYTVIGIKKLDYIKKDGTRCYGHIYYLEFEGDDIDGIGCESAFIKGDVLVNVGDVVNAHYNKYGNISMFTLV